MGVRIESTLVADLVVTLCTGVEVWLVRGGSEFCCLAYRAKSAAWKGRNLWDRIRWGRGAASVWWNRGRPSWFLTSGIHLESPPRSICLLAGLMTPHIFCALTSLSRLRKGWGSWSLSCWVIQLIWSSGCTEISLKIQHVHNPSFTNSNNYKSILKHSSHNYGKPSIATATAGHWRQTYNPFHFMCLTDTYIGT